MYVTKRTFENLTLLAIVLIASVISFNAATAENEEALNGVRRAARERVMKRVADGTACRVDMDLFGRLRNVSVQDADEDGVSVGMDGEPLDVEWDNISDTTLADMVLTVSGGDTPGALMEASILYHAAGRDGVTFLKKAVRIDPKRGVEWIRLWKSVFGVEPRVNLKSPDETKSKTDGDEKKNGESNSSNVGDAAPAAGLGDGKPGSGDETGTGAPAVFKPNLDVIVGIRDDFKQRLISLADDGRGCRISVDIFGRMATVDVTNVDDDGIEVRYGDDLLDLDWNKIDDAVLAGMVLDMGAGELDAATRFRAGVLIRYAGAFSEGQSLMADAMRADPDKAGDFKAMRHAVFGAERKKVSFAAVKADSKKTEQSVSLPGPGSASYCMARPRLFMRADTVADPNILTREEFIRTTSSGRRAIYKKWVLNNENNVAFLAAKWLYNQDAKAADKAIRTMMTPGGGYGWYDCSRWMVPYSIAYDWLQDYPGFDEQEKQRVRAVLVKGLKGCMVFMDTRGRHLASNCFLIPFGGVVTGAIALYGEDPLAEQAMKMVERYLEDDLANIFYELNGGWPEGWSYYIESTEWLCIALEAYRSFSGRDMWRYKIRDGYPYLMFIRGLMNGCRPDHTFMRWGDIGGGSMATTELHTAYYIQPAIRSCQDEELMWFLKDIERVHGRRAYNDSKGTLYLSLYGLLYGFDKEIPARKPTHLSVLMAPNSMAMTVMRSGWEKDSSFITFRCGDYIGPGHNDYDTGHFSIFCGKGLLIDSGYYAKIGSPHYSNYKKKAVAHNVILAGEPGENGNEGDQRVTKRGTLYNIQDLLNPGGNETGDLIAFEEHGTWCYTAGDLSAAYKTGIQKWVRELVYIRPGTLIVLDRVAASAQTEKRFLLHTVTEPVVQGNRIDVDNVGTMKIVSLLPSDAAVRVIGGKGKEFWWNGKNWTQGIHGAAPFNQPGAWRAEIYQKPGQSRTTFLTVFTFGMGNVSNDATLKRGGGLAVTVQGRTVTFSNTPGTVTVK